MNPINMQASEPQLNVPDFPHKKLILLCDLLFSQSSAIMAEMRSGGKQLSRNYEPMLVTYFDIYYRTKEMMTDEEKTKFEIGNRERTDAVMVKVEEFLKFLQQHGIYPLGHEEPSLGWS